MTISDKILLITNKEDVTVDFIIVELQRRNIFYYRLNTEEIPSTLNINFDFNNESYMLFDSIKGKQINLLDFTAVYFRRPKINNFSYIDNVSDLEIRYLQSELSFVLEGIYKLIADKFWLNNVYRIREAENKIYQLTLAKNAGFRIPSSFITNLKSQLNNLASIIGNNCIIKPIKSGVVGNDICSKVIFTTKVQNHDLEPIERFESFPVYIQENIHKRLDLRIIVVGKNVFAAEIDSQKNSETQIDWRRGENILDHAIHNLPEELKYMCIQLTQKLGLNFSAIDMILDEKNNYYFLEINPNGQWAWLERRLGFPISKCIVDLLVEGEKSE